jgi:hypothetical protein
VELNGVSLGWIRRYGREVLMIRGSNIEPETIGVTLKGRLLILLRLPFTSMYSLLDVVSLP